ncbi:MAG: biopolymer transporter ExbD [Planctomycetaceae bacterium]|nr:biopolymer transporter ExbD [Planctomycetaceae bacterium]
MKVPRHHRSTDYGGMTAMIDIVFLLLVFFVIGAAGLPKEETITTVLPTQGSIATPAPQERPPQQIDVWLKLLVGPKGRTVVDMNGTSYDDLKFLKEQLKLLADFDPSNPVVLDVEADVPYGDVVDIYDTCIAAGFDNIEFATGEQSG